MRIAILHDYLNQLGGGERVLEELITLFPKAPVYTLFYDETRTQNRFSQSDIHTSFLQYIPGVARYHHAAIPLMPIAAKSLRVRDVDVVFSDSSGYAKGISVDPNILHINYCYTPIRYAWEEEYLNTHGLFKHLRHGIKPILSSLRKWDRYTSALPHEMYAVSAHIAKKIKLHYNRDVGVLYPPARTDFFYPTQKKGNFYLAVGRMLHYKRFDLIISAFNILGLPLKIVGSGPEYKRLKEMAHDNIEFLGRVSDEVLRDYYSSARALIFPQQEDFGLVVVEALSCGTPVIAFKKGGGPEEIINEGKNGLFFEEQTTESLISAIHIFEKSDFKKDVCCDSALRFSPEQFKVRVHSIVDNAMKRFYEDRF
ncbi:MAG: glycosyltransferase [Parcubacteria group bacterium]|nr:glycosyltransferase [Parcubacteria group bacterium]